MLLSPSKIHTHLTTLTSQTIHTALLLTTTGQILSSASSPFPDFSSDTDAPDLDEPERLRLILGLASQWGEDESPRMECELGRLYFHTIPLAPIEVVPGMQAVGNANTNMGMSKLLLVLNGSEKANWKDMAAKAEGFSKDWAYR